MHGGFKLFHILIGGKGFTFLQATQSFGEVHMDAWSRQGLTTPPVMIAPQPGETLLVYISVTNRVISMAIIVEREEVGHAYKV